MKTATAKRATIANDLLTGSIFVPHDRDLLDMLVGSGTLPVVMPDLEPGADYYIDLIEKQPVARKAESADFGGAIGGFHYAPGGNATARAGGDDVPAINPFSCWDSDWRPACPDPRGMTCVELGNGTRVWVDIYLTGQHPWRDGTSKCGARIADGYDDLPVDEQGKTFKKLDHPTTIKILAAFGKELLSVEEFFAAAFGVTEATSIGDDPETTGLDAPRTSKWGVMQATGNMSIWGTDGDPDGPNRASLFGGRWDYGAWAGSRYAYVEDWPGRSYEWVGARGRSDHLQPVTA